jgi:hypothetical protein
VECLRGHFGAPDPHGAAYTEVLGPDGVTDPLLVPSVLPGEGSARDEAAAEAIDRRLRGAVRVELSAVPSSSFSPSALAQEQQQQPAAAICLTLPASLPANEDALRRSFLDALPSGAGGGDVFVTVDFPDDDEKEGDEDASTLKDDADSALSDILQGDSVSATPAHGRDPLLQSISIYSSWHYRPSLPSGAGGGASSSHPVTGRLTNEELQIRHLEAEVRRLQSELEDVATTRPFDDIRDDLDRCRSQLRRLRWKRWVPWW